MKYVIIYWSRYGHNKKLAESLVGVLKNRGADAQVFTTEQADPAAMQTADLYVFSAAAEAFSLQRNMKTFLKRLSGMDGKKYGIINTHAMKRNWLKTMEKLLSKKNMTKVAELDFQIQKEGMDKGNGLPQGWEAKLEEFAKNL